MEQFQKLMKNKSYKSNLSYKTHRTYKTYKTYKTNTTYRTYKSHMTYLSYIVLFVLLFSFFVTPQKTAHAGVLSRPPTNLGLVGYWPMDEGTGNKVIDASGQGNMGTKTGATWTNGKHGKALSLTQSSACSSYADMGDPASGLYDFGTGDFTVAFWVKKRVQSSSWSNTWGVEKWNTGGTPGSNEWGIGLSGLTGNDSTPAFSIESGSSQYAKNGTYSMGLNTWYHLVGVRNGTAMRLYMNAVAQGSDTVLPGGMAINNVGRELTIGYSPLGVYCSNADFDDIRLYNRALTATEISKLYSSGAVRTKSGAGITQIETAINESNCTGAICTVNFVTPTTKGELIVVDTHPFYDGNSVVNITDNLGNTYTQVWSMSYSHISSYLYYLANAPAGVTSVTITIANGYTTAGAVAAHYTGIASINPLDVYYTPNTTGSSTPWATFPRTTTQSNELLIGTNFCWSLSGSNTISPSGNWIQDRFINAGAISGNNGHSMAFAHQIVSSIQTNIQNTGTNPAGVCTNYSGFAAFKAKLQPTKINSSQNNKLTNGLIGLWSFNGPDMNFASTTAEVLDRSGQGNNGNNFGATVTQGKLGQALRFNGVDNYVVTPSLGTPPNSITLSAWIKPNPAGGVVMAELDQKIINSGWHDVQMEVETDKSIKVCMWTGSLTCVVATTNITYGNWYHVVMTYNLSGTLLSSYVNGVAGGSTVATKQYPVALFYGIGPVDITNAGNGNYFSGAIDEVRIYNRALSADEVKQLYNMGK